MRSLPLILLCALLAHPAAAQEDMFEGLERSAGAKAMAPARESLVYHRRAGVVAATEIRIAATVPGAGNVGAALNVSERVTTAGARGFAVQAQVTVSGDIPSGAAAGAYTVSPDGRVSALRSAELNDRVLGAYVRDLELLYVPLPREPIAPGSSWAASLTIYPPLPKKLLQIAPLTLAMICRLTALGGTAAHPIAHVAVSAVQAPGQTTRASLRGSYEIDLAQGRIVRAQLTGTVTPHVFVLPVTVPFSLAIAARGPAV